MMGACLFKFDAVRECSTLYSGNVACERCNAGKDPQSLTTHYLHQRPLSELETSRRFFAAYAQWTCGHCAKDITFQGNESVRATAEGGNGISPGVRAEQRGELRLYSMVGEAEF